MSENVEVTKLRELARRQNLADRAPGKHTSQHEPSQPGYAIAIEPSELNVVVVVRQPLQIQFSKAIPGEFKNAIHRDKQASGVERPQPQLLQLGKSLDVQKRGT